MTWPQALLIAAAAAGSMVASWTVICAVLPSIRLREAAVVNLGSGAVANTLPAGGALAMGVSWAMLSGWGITPGGLGITKLGLVTRLAAGAGHRASVQVTAAVLLYRAVTYLPTIPLGALACLVWRLAPALNRASPYDAAPAPEEIT